MFLLDRVALGLTFRPKAKQPDHKSETRARGRWSPGALSWRFLSWATSGHWILMRTG